MQKSSNEKKNSEHHFYRYCFIALVIVVGGILITLQQLGYFVYIQPPNVKGKDKPKVPLNTPVPGKPPSCSNPDFAIDSNGECTCALTEAAADCKKNATDGYQAAYKVAGTNCYLCQCANFFDPDTKNNTIKPCLTCLPGYEFQPAVTSGPNQHNGQCVPKKTSSGQGNDPNKPPDGDKDVTNPTTDLSTNQKIVTSMNQSQWMGFGIGVGVILLIAIALFLAYFYEYDAFYKLWLLFICFIFIISLVGFIYGCVLWAQYNNDNSTGLPWTVNGYLWTGEIFMVLTIILYIIYLKHKSYFKDREKKVQIQNREIREKKEEERKKKQLEEARKKNIEMMRKSNKQDEEAKRKIAKQMNKVLKERDKVVSDSAKMTQQVENENKVKQKKSLLYPLMTLFRGNQKNNNEENYDYDRESHRLLGQTNHP